MAYCIQRADYFYTNVRDEPGEAYRLLKQLEAQRISLNAFSAVPFGPDLTQLILFPDDTPQLVEAARRANMTLDGPYPALLVTGDDELGALAGIHEKLAQANVNVYASTGVVGGRGGFGYVIYVRPDQFPRAAKVLNV
jgi:hypothetical protein